MKKVLGWILSILAFIGLNVVVYNIHDPNHDFQLWDMFLIMYALTAIFLFISLIAWLFNSDKNE